jgi:hypothetical protein
LETQAEFRIEPIKAVRVTNSVNPDTCRARDMLNPSFHMTSLCAAKKLLKESQSTSRSSGDLDWPYLR